MTDLWSLRPAEQEDFSFCERLYFDNIWAGLSRRSVLTCHAIAKVSQFNGGRLRSASSRSGAKMLAGSRRKWRTTWSSSATACGSSMFVQVINAHGIGGESSEGQVLCSSLSKRQQTSPRQSSSLRRDAYQLAGVPLAGFSNSTRPEGAKGVPLKDAGLPDPSEALAFEIAACRTVCCFDETVHYGLRRLRCHDRQSIE
jgi:hypothetical protein